LWGTAPKHSILESPISVLIILGENMDILTALLNSIALRYKQSVVVHESTGKTPAQHIRGLLLDISQLGYTLDGQTVRALRTLDETQFKFFHDMLVTNLKNMVGDDVHYRPLFKNFPNDIPDDADYFIRRLIGHVETLIGFKPEESAVLSCGHVIDSRLFNLDDFGACPICQMQVDELDDEEDDRPSLDEVTPLKVIRLISENDVLQVFTNLLASKTSISAEDKAVIISLVEEDPSMFTMVPPVIPMKENAALICALAVEYEHDENSGFCDYTHVAAELLLDNMKTATDILRLAAALSKGDVSLAEPTRFRLSNKERKIIMGLLNEVKHPEEDMARYKMRWIRLAEVIHAGKYAKKFPNAFKAIQILRNEPDSIETFSSKVEKLVTAVNNGDKASETNLVKLLATRPGEFARRLDWMMRTFKAPGLIYETFKSHIVSSLTTPMLLTLSAHLKNRSEVAETRYFMPKGNVAKLQVIEDNRKLIKPFVINNYVKRIDDELLSRFSDRGENLGNVYINPELKGYLVPLVQRNATKSLVTIPRGSHVALPENKFVRMFLYWKENPGDRVDVDLSAIAYDADWNYKFHVSYTDISAMGSVHSGDIQSAPNGAAEFIDLDVMKSINAGVRYVVMNVISFTGQPFDTFECFAGIMGRDNPSMGKKFEAKTVKHKFDVAGNTRYNIPLILDLETDTLIWADIALSSRVNSNVEGQSNKVVMMSNAIASMINDKPNMFDLLTLHAQARGKSISYEREERKVYDTEFDIDFATNADDIMANWL
jgi:hypothetical protein